VKHYSLEEIYAYLDGEMTSMEKSLFEDHILVCKECASKLEEARKFFSFVKIEEEEPPINISSLVMEKIDKKRRYIPFFYAFLVVLLATLLLPVIIGPSRAMYLYYIEFNAVKKGYHALETIFRLSSLLKIPGQALIIGIVLAVIPFVVIGLKKIWRKI